MDVVDVDSLHSQIGSAVAEHRTQIAWSHAVRSLDDVARLDNSRLEKILLKPCSRVGRHLPVESDISTLGGYQNLIAIDLAAGGEFGEHTADNTLAALASIIDG